MPRLPARKVRREIGRQVGHQTLGGAAQRDSAFEITSMKMLDGRVYLPLEDLAVFGCTVDDLRVPAPTVRVRQLIDFECRRAHTFYQRALDARPPEDRRRLVAAEIMRAVYFETLKRIERGGHDVFTTRVRVARPRQALIALRQWVWPR